MIVRGWLGALRGEVGRQAHEEAIRDRDDALVAAFAFGDEQPSFTGSDIAESKAEDHAGCANACFLANTDADSRAVRGHGPFALPPARVLPLPPPPGPLGHVDHLAEPRARHARLADHLEVLEGPAGPSADFLHTRISTAASPNAWVRSATSASNLLLTDRGTRLPAASAVLPASRKSAFHRPMDCSLIISRRAASAIVISPTITLNTIRVFFSAEIRGWSSHAFDSPSGLTQLSCHKV